MRISSLTWEKILVGLFLMLALFLRLESVTSNLHQPLMGDAQWYEERGWSIAQGKIDLAHHHFYRPPLYPLFISFIYLMFGRSPLAILSIQALLGMVICWLIYLIGKKLMGVNIGLLSLAFCTLSISLIKVSSLFLTECFFTFLLVLGIYLLVHLCHGRGWKIGALLGLVMGLATLTKAGMIVFPLFIVGGILFLRSWNWLQRISLSLVVLLAFTFTLLPWSVRNFLHYGQWVLISTHGGISFYSSYRPPEGKLFGFTAHDETTRYAETAFKSEIDRSRFLFREGLRFIRENPDQLLKLELLKLAFLWIPFDWEIIGGGTLNVGYAFLLPFTLWGMALLLKRFKTFWILYFPIFYLHFLSLVFYGSPRFRLPYEPILILFSAFGLVHFFSLFSRKWIPFISTGVWLGIQWLLFLNSDLVRFQAKNFAVQLGLW